MPTSILATKLHIPAPGHSIILRPRLLERLNAGLQRSLTLISAPAGFGKTTLISEWVAHHHQHVAWLSLDEGDNDLSRFLAYLIATLQTVGPTLGAGISGALQSPQLPPVEMILTALLNEITTLPNHIILVLDDYHVITTTSIDDAFSFLLKHMPSQMHLVIATREDPHLPLARLRSQDQLTDLRVADLRFTAAEATEFLNRMMGLKLSSDDIAALETRTEGWIAGLQLAAISLQGQQDATSFIQSFSGSHHFVLDYLTEEVLQQQPEKVQTFLLQTSLLNRMCGPLCDAMLLEPAGSGQATLEYLERANLFIVPLDDKRQWFRYHHLFADLLRQRLNQSLAASVESFGGAASTVKDLHLRASQWFEEHGLEVEAFQHATAANDIERAERLIEGRGIPLHLRGAVTIILDWLGSLPKTVLDERPSLWVRYASFLLVNGQTTGVEERLRAAEVAQPLFQSAELDDTVDEKTRNLVGQIATARATLALTRYQPETMITQSLRALKYLRQNNLALRANANWTLGYAYLLLGDRTASRSALVEAISLSQAAGDVFTTILATIGLGNVQETENQLFQAADTYRRVLQLAGHQPLQIIHEAHLGLARVLYEWNDLVAAERHAQQALQLARQYERVIDRFIICEIFLARLMLTQGDVSGAATLLAEANQSAHQPNFVHRLPEVATAQVSLLLHQGKLSAAADLAQTYQLPLSQARVFQAQGNPSAALAVLDPWCRQVEAKGLADEQLKAMVLQAIALWAQDEKAAAVQVLLEALTLAEPGGFMRLFVDEGPPMEDLLLEASADGRQSDYISRLLAHFEVEKQHSADKSGASPSSAISSQTLLEPLSQREIEVLRLIAQGLSNHEISQRLFLALSTVKGHNRNIFDKLQVQRRTEAVARARELGLL